MKKIFLLITACVFAISAGAQQPIAGGSTPAIPFDPIKMREMVTHEVENTAAAKITSVTTRWYNYADWLYRYAAVRKSLGLSPDSVVMTTPLMWQDNRSLNLDTATMLLDTCNLVSVGNIWNPQWAEYNNSVYYTPLTTMAMTLTDPYTVDSVIIQGEYGFNPSRIGAVKDTLRLSFIKGTLGPKTTNDIWVETLAGTHWGSVLTGNLFYDPINNRTEPQFSAPDVLTIIMNVGDTIAGGSYYLRVALADIAKYGGTGILSCAPGELLGMTVSFKSGDPYFTPYDTVLRDTLLYGWIKGGMYKYNMFRPFVNYVSTGGTTTEWPLYGSPSPNVNTGLFKTLPDATGGWGGKYIPEYQFTDGAGGPSQWQNPYIWMHVNCATCGVIMPGVAKTNILSAGVAAVPNPANDIVAIDFSLSGASTVSVSLINMTGQVVAKQEMDNTVKGQVTFNTSGLPAGVYIYNIEANGEHSIGRVVIAH